MERYHVVTRGLSPCSGEFNGSTLHDGKFFADCRHLWHSLDWHEIKYLLLLERNLKAGRLRGDITGTVYKLAVS